MSWVMGCLPVEIIFIKISLIIFFVIICVLMGCTNVHLLGLVSILLREFMISYEVHHFIHFGSG